MSTADALARLAPLCASQRVRTHDGTLTRFSQMDQAALGSPMHSLDSEKHPKGKRKRTGARDKSILEEAYQSNTKPDKQARLDIVARVTLTEKEVQIWFQNRRQNDRRKSRPLSQEELAALRITGGNPFEPLVGMPDVDRAMFTSDRAESQASNRAPMSPLPSNEKAQEQASLDALDTTSNTQDGVVATAEKRPVSQQSNAVVQAEASPANSLERFSLQALERGSCDSMSPCFPGSVGYLANRWNIGSAFCTRYSDKGSLGGIVHEPKVPFVACSATEAAPAPSGPGANVRLSLSLDGKAAIISGKNSVEQQQGPPRPASTLASGPQTRRAGFQRSHSALPYVTLPPISTVTSLLPPRLARGRSRDVHAWESCAGSEKRDGLTAQAELESNGSAIAAISLLRSSSGVLQPNTAKRNAPVAKVEQSKKAKFGRTSSTYARMETVAAEPAKKYSKVKVSSMLASPTDSDKENWSPDAAGNPQRRHRQQQVPDSPLSKPRASRRSHRPLGENKAWAALGSRSNTSPMPSGSRASGADDDDDDDGRHDIVIFEDASSSEHPCDEVERFMRGDVSPSKKGDLDCVAGLLSLSQGAWR
ncbi:hypothetical protein CDD81_4925 [Ophiocordyceps australis]|uniref:Homeobox domain-containing protein n=1 Tax=Ophiocordyceps australis TaxID=1399860 RepID=A0A2C5XIT2_9HYPO|nr:hypothetical protein CDD81_4925 [Ophiocordyceps australis]